MQLLPDPRLRSVGHRVALFVGDPGITALQDEGRVQQAQPNGTAIQPLRKHLERAFTGARQLQHQLLFAAQYALYLV